jgi:uncharacterized phage protein gp47/JayE
VTAALTPAGLTIDTQAEILAAIEQDQRDEISDSLDQSTSSVLGQVNRLVSRAHRLTQEALAAIYLAADPDSATGAALLALCAITGTEREPATASRCRVTVDLDAGTYAAGSLVIAPEGRPEDRFANRGEGVSAGAGDDVVFAAQETGPIDVPADTFEIADALAGFNSITSHPAATPGNDIETEAALRARRNAEVESPGSSSPSGIAADLTRELPLIESVSVTENDTDATVDSVPPHSLEVIVYGPDPATSDDDQAVADQIWASKAGGIGTYGTTSKTVTDSAGVTHTIRFTRPADDVTTCALTVLTRSTYQGDTALKNALEAAALEALVPGLDLSWSMLVQWAHEADPAILRVTAVTVNGVSFGTNVVDSRSIARLSVADITITSSVGSP